MDEEQGAFVPIQVFNAVHSPLLSAAPYLACQKGAQLNTYSPLPRQRSLEEHFVKARPSMVTSIALFLV